MGETFLVFLVILVVIGALTRETFIFLIIYLFAGSYLVGKWWSTRVVSAIRYRREFIRKAFPGEDIPVTLEVENSSRLPAIWLSVRDFVAPEIAAPHSFQEVISLGGKQRIKLNYRLKTQKRGYYPIGPVNIASGDLLGLSEEKSGEGLREHITVYPKVLGLPNFHLPSRSPMGTLRYQHPIYADPSRPMGKRDYRQGDSLRQIDWKASAVTNRLQVKLLEPTIALETQVFLDLCSEHYTFRTRFDATELAIVLAASICSHSNKHKQIFGMLTNGEDPLAPDLKPSAFLPKKGYSHLMRILEVLARIRTTTEDSFPNFVSHHTRNLNWGTTLIIISGSISVEMFQVLSASRRMGLIPVIMLCGDVPDLHDIKSHASTFQMDLYHFHSEQDIRAWRLIQ